MKNITRITALTLSVLTLASAFSCGKDRDKDKSLNESSVTEEQSAKTVIDIAWCTYEEPAVSNRISAFSKNNESYTINLTNYWDVAWEEYKDESGDDPYFYEKKAREMLHMDMISGKVPDIIIGETDVMLSFLNGDYFTDMYPLMDAGTVPRDAFLPNFLKGFEIEGQLPLLAYGVTLETAVALSSDIGREYEHWTLDEMKKYCGNSMPDDKSLLDYRDSIYDIPDYVLYAITRECVDYTTAECDFHGSFIDALEYAKSINIGENEHIDGSQDFVIRHLTINGISSIFSQEIVYSGLGGKDFTFVGYPSSDGCGAVVGAMSNPVFGILENSDCKEGAWEFLSSLFEESFQVNLTLSFSGLPMIESAVDKAMNKDQWSSGSINAILGTDEEGNDLQIDENSKKLFEEYIRNIEIRPYSDKTVDEIVREEYMKAVNGECTAQECADTIENRIRLYLSERS